MVAAHRDSVGSSARIEADLQVPLSSAWNKIPGILVHGTHVAVDPEKYFFRYESPSWLLCDWNRVKAELLDAEEDPELTYEQRSLLFIRANGAPSSDGGQVLQTAEKVYSYIFRDEQLEDPGLAQVTPRHLQILREMGTLMALNRVELTGHASTVGPAWFFPVCSQAVFDLSRAEAEQVDELYHGTFFNESRRIESVKAHAALGGRLVHGCQSKPDMAGGCIVSYGTSISRFRDELQSFKHGWMDRIRQFR